MLVEVGVPESAVVPPRSFAEVETGDQCLQFGHAALLSPQRIIPRRRTMTPPDAEVGSIHCRRDLPCLREAATRRVPG